MAVVQVKESYFWQQVKAGLEDSYTHMCRIENTAGTGISDVNVCFDGREVWLELKVFHGNRLHFRNSQRSWILRRAAVGGRVYVVARDGDTMLMYLASEVVSATSTALVDKKSFYIERQNLPEPLLECRKPFKWAGMHKKLFGES